MKEQLFTINQKYLESKFSSNDLYIIESSELRVILKTDTETHFKSISKYGVITFSVPNKYIEMFVDDYDNYTPKKRTASPIKKDLVINHPTFGTGTVLSNKKGITEIQFECGKKKFDTNYIKENCLN